MNSAVDMIITLTLCRRTAAINRGAAITRSREQITSRAPASSGAQISKVAASNDGSDTWATRSLAVSET